MINHIKDNVTYLTYENFESLPEVLSIVTTRHKGVSSGVYASLNLALHVGDSYGAVIKNREILGKTFDIDPKSPVLGEQVHGNKVAVVNQKDKGKGALSLDSTIKGVDALVTNVAGLPLTVLIADCAAVSFYDPVKKVIGLSHAGWRGTAKKIVSKTVAKMMEEFESEPKDIIVGVSPTIGPSRFEVDEKVFTAFKKSFGGDAFRFFTETDKDKWNLNLWSALEFDLENAGIKKENIEIMAICTACNTNLFYSYRAENGRTGRFGSLIMLKK